MSWKPGDKLTACFFILPKSSFSSHISDSWVYWTQSEVLCWLLIHHHSATVSTSKRKNRCWNIWQSVLDFAISSSCKPFCHFLWTLPSMRFVCHCLHFPGLFVRVWTLCIIMQSVGCWALISIASHNSLIGLQFLPTKNLCLQVLARLLQSSLGVLAALTTKSVQIINAISITRNSYRAKILLRVQ